MKIRVIDTGEGTGSWNMAVDESLLDSELPVLRFYTWDKPTISLGYFQKSEEANLSFIRERDLGLVRRLTGGKAVLHHRELTYSMIFTEEFIPGSVIETYRAISVCLTEGLKALGVPAVMMKKDTGPVAAGNCFESISWYEIAAEGKKLVGSAQTRRRGKVLQHGSIILDWDRELIAGCFRDYSPEEQPASAVKDFLTEIPGTETIREVLTRSITEGLKADRTDSELTGREKETAEKLDRERYASPEWTLRR